MMELRFPAKVIKGVGGIYEIRLSKESADELRSLGIEPDRGDRLCCKARGVFRHERVTLLAGDNVTVRIDAELMLADMNGSGKKDAQREKQRSEARAGVMIEEILERKDELIRPPMANLDRLFVVFAATKPEPSLTTVDKLVTIAEYKKIEPVIVVTKADLAPDAAERYAGIYKKCGFDGNDYSVLDVYVDYNPDLPLNMQQKNPNCVLYSMLDVLIAISVFGAAVDVIPWFFYDVSETGQKSMLRVIRLRTLIEDYHSDKGEIENYIEGCEAVFTAQKYENAEKLDFSKEELRQAKQLPKNTSEEAAVRKEKLKELRKRRNEYADHNEEIEIAKFVMFEIRRFSTDFGKKQLELAKLVAEAGEERFYDVYEQAVELSRALPRTHVKEERVWRRQEIRNANALKRSAKLAYKYYPDGKISFDPQIVEDAYDLPDDTPEQQKLRRKAMKKANKAQNIYAKVAMPYLSALRTVKLAEGYENLDEITADYEEAKRSVAEKRSAEEAELKRLAEERKLDIERKRAQRKMKK